MKMGADIRTTLQARVDRSRNDRYGFSGVVSSDDDDDDVEPGEVSDPAFRSLGNLRVGDSYILDSDSDDSLLSEISLATGLPTGSTILTSQIRDTSSDEEDVGSGPSARERSASIGNPTCESNLDTLGKHIINTVGQQGDVRAQDGCDAGVNYSTDADERSRLMAAAQAASIPSDNSFSDGNDGDERSRLMAAAQAAAIPSDSSFSSDESEGDERSRLMAAAQAAAIPSDNSFGDDSEGDERSRLMAAPILSDYSFGDDSEGDKRSRLMAAAQAAAIPSNDSFSDDSDDGVPHAGWSSKRPQMTREASTIVVPTVTKANLLSGDLDSDEGFGFTDIESDSEAYSTDDVTRKVSSTVHTKTKAGGYGFRKFSKISSDAREKDSDYESFSSAWGEVPRGKNGRKARKSDVNSASFSASATSFKWSNVKTKIFYSFRNLKASGTSSSGDGSRTISVKNLAKEVTDDRLHDFFQDSGTILDIWIVRDTQSGLSSAYVEFDSGSAARKAVQKSGKKLEGRVILCDTAYETSRGGGRSALGSGHGAAKAARSNSFNSDSESVNRRLAENYAALKMFHPDLQVGDAEFLGRFNEQGNLPRYDDIAQPFTRSLPRPSGGESRHPEGSKGKAILPWTDSYEENILRSGKTQGELGESIYYDAINLESQRSVSFPGRQYKGSLTQRKGILSRFLWSWNWSRWQRSAWARRPCRGVATEEKKIAICDKRWHKRP